MMSDVSKQRCARHAGRRAAAQCLECGRYFCRECVTEHDDRVICSTCLKALAASSKGGLARAAQFLTIARSVIGLIVLWLTFYGGGRALLLLTDKSHETDFWKSTMSLF